MAEKKQGLPMYPTMPQNANPGPYPGNYPQQQGYPQVPQGGPPPPYSYGHPEPTQMHQGPPPSYYPNMPPTQFPQQQYSQQPLQYPQQQQIHMQNMPGNSSVNNTVYVQGGYFDAGARFGRTGGQVRVPPPPPGYQPTPAQMAALNGQAVQMDQRKAGFFSGGKGAGFTF